MASGGVVSPTDPIGNTQYSEDEIHAIVIEAEAAQTYVMAHACTAKAIARGFFSQSLFMDALSKLFRFSSPIRDLPKSIGRLCLSAFR